MRCLSAGEGVRAAIDYIFETLFQLDQGTLTLFLTQCCSTTRGPDHDSW